MSKLIANKILIVTGLLTVMLCLVFGCAFIPADHVHYVHYNNRIFIVSLGITGYFVLRKFANNTTISFGLYDILFLSFILLTFLSQFWARNPIDAVSVSFSWLFYYSVFKFFQDWNLYAEHKQFFSIFLQILLFYNLAILLFYFFYKGLSIDNFTLQFTKQQINEFGAMLKLNRNYVAIYLVTLSGIPLYYLIYLKGKWSFPIGFACVILLSTSLLLIRSRGGMLLILSILIIYTGYSIWLKKSRWFILPVILISVYACFEFVSYFQQNEKNYIFLLDPFYGVKSETGDDRLHLWKITIQLFLEKPILGYGSGSWIYEYMKYGVGDLYAIDFTKNYFKTTHNEFLNILFCNGILGLCLFLILVIFYPVFLFIKTTRENKIDMNAIISKIGLFAILFMMLFYDGFDIRGGVLLGNSLMASVFLGVLIKDTRVLSKALPFILIIACSLSSIFYYQNIKSNLQRQKLFYQQLKKENYEACKDIIKDLESSLVGYSHIGNTTDYLNFKLMEKMQCSNDFIHSLEKQLKRDPYNFNLWYGLGVENQRLHFLNKAETCFEKALLYNCDYTKAKVRLYYINILSGNINKAQWYMNELHEIEVYLKQYKANEAQWKNFPKAVRKNKYYKRLANQIKKFNKIQGIQSVK